MAKFTPLDATRPAGTDLIRVTDDYQRETRARVNALDESTDTRLTAVESGTFDVITVTNGITGDLFGNADTATTLETSRNFTVSGDATTASAQAFNGSGNVDLAITLADNSVTTGKIAASSVTNAKLANNSITVTAGANSTSIPLGSTITFSGSPNEVEVTQANGTVTVGLPNNVTIGGALSVTGDLTVNGTTHTVNSTNYTVDDVIITIGDGTTSQDGKDRGTSFKYHNGTSIKTGFYGFDASAGKMTFIPDATITNEVVSGTKGTLVANVEGDLTGNVTGNTTGIHYGNLGKAGGYTAVDVSGTSAVFTGSLTGNVTGNLTGSTTGAHNGTVGATSPNTGAFTTVSASTSASIGGFNMKLSGGNLVIDFNGTNLFKLTQSGDLSVIGDITAKATL